MGCAPPRLVSSVGGQHLWGLDSEAGGGGGVPNLLSPLLYLEAGQGKGQSFHSAKEHIYSFRSIYKAFYNINININIK